MLGLGLALLAYSLLAVQDATIKVLVATVPVWQVLFVRAGVILLGCLAGGGRPLVRTALRTPNKNLLLRRGAVALAAWFCYFTAARGLPLGQLTTLYFVAPVIVTLLAVPLLGEHVGRMRWVAVGLGFVGTILAADPRGVSFSFNTALVLVAAVLWGYGVILMRQIARRESSLMQMFYNNAVFLIVAGVASLLAWQPLDAQQAALLLAVAVVGGLGQLSLFEAIRHAPASAIAPLEYTALIWAFLLGFVVWGDEPSVHVFLGAGFILCAGSVLLVTERRGRRAKES